MTTANSETPAGNPKRKRWLLILLAVIVLATLASVAWEFFYGRWPSSHRAKRCSPPMSTSSNWPRPTS